MCILELSKVLTYEFYYEYIKNKYSNKSRLSFTDTDSLMYEIKTEDVYKDFSNDKVMLDFDFFCENPNKSIVGKMKDETAGVTIEEFVGLKPKMYSYLVDDNSEHKKAKGVNKNVVARIRQNEYKDDKYKYKIC